MNCLCQATINSILLCLIYLLQDKPGVRHVWVPLVLTGIFAYLVAHCFITVYEVRK